MKAIERFSQSQTKRLKQEIRRQVALENEKYERSFDILLMYILHSVFGFGQARLSRMYASMRESRDELKKRYMADGDCDSDDCVFAMERDLCRVQYQNEKAKQLAAETQIKMSEAAGED